MDYVSMRVSTLRGDQKISFDAYVKINDKMVLYIRKGDSFEGQRLKRLKEKKLKKMYILTQDEANYRSYMQNNIEMAYDNKSGKDISTRSEIIQGEQQSNTEAVFENPEDAQAYQSTKDAAGKYVDFLLNNSKAITAVMNIENIDKNSAHHGVTVSTLSVALAHRIAGLTPDQVQILALGALLHDFGHHELNSNMALNPSQMTPEQWANYQKHTATGAARVQDKKHFDAQVIRIIKEHEECIDGSGYPEKLPEAKLDPLSIIVGSCNVLDRYISFEGVPKPEAAKKIMMERVGKHPLNHLQHLTNVLKEMT